MQRLDYIYEEAQKYEPGIMKLCEPRTYEGYGPCNSYRKAVAGRFAMYYAARLAKAKAYDQARADPAIARELLAGGSLNPTMTDTNSRIAFCATTRSQQFNHPTFFVAPEFLKAVMATRLPVMAMKDLNWPMEVMTFVFPRGAVISPLDGECPFLTVARVEKGWRYGVNGVADAESDTNNVSLYTYGSDNGAPLFAACIDIDGKTTSEWVEAEVGGLFL